MRIPNYKVGWLIQNKVAALTHFHSEITHEDIIGVFTETQKLLQDVNEPFQIIIDNRLAPINKIYSLEELQKSSSVLRHPFLHYLIIVKPNHLELSTKEVISEKRENVCLKNVSSINEALAFINKVLPELSQLNIDNHFFANEPA